MRVVRQMILAGCTLGVGLTAIAEQRSMEAYKSIVDRNPFGLKDPPVQQLAATNKPPVEKKPEDFFLTGISTIGDPKRPKAYLLNKDASKKEYNEKYYTMTVGDKQGEVTMKEIDPKGRRVLIAYLGEDRWLSMKDNGVPAPAGPAPGAMPLVPGAPGSIPLPGGAIPAPLPNAGRMPSVQQPQPLGYPNTGNQGRRVPRSIYNGAAANNPANASANMPGPQTPGEIAEQIARMKAANSLKPPTPF